MAINNKHLDFFSLVEEDWFSQKGNVNKLSDY